MLIAEDNPVNVEVAREHLGQLGLTCDVAQNGAEAIHLVKRGDYQLVLMDCQMPDVDGLQATRRIRALEARHGRPRLPIIAVTANAYAADRVACLEAGMDDYLAKPFTEDALVASLSRWLQPAAGANASRFGVLDAARVAELRAVKSTLYARVGTAFLTQSPKLIADLNEAAAAGNVAALQMTAHSIKSSSANVGASRLVTLCAALEVAAAQHRADDAITAVRDIAAELRAVGHSIEDEVKRAS